MVRLKIKLVNDCEILHDQNLYIHEFPNRSGMTGKDSFLILTQKKKRPGIPGRYILQKYHYFINIIFFVDV
jgi:hypothetical protein